MAGILFYLRLIIVLCNSPDPHLQMRKLRFKECNASGGSRNKSRFSGFCSAAVLGPLGLQTVLHCSWPLPTFDRNPDDSFDFLMTILLEILPWIHKPTTMRLSDSQIELLLQSSYWHIEYFQSFRIKTEFVCYLLPKNNTPEPKHAHNNLIHVLKIKYKVCTNHIL